MSHYETHATKVSYIPPVLSGAWAADAPFVTVNYVQPAWATIPHSIQYIIRLSGQKSSAFRTKSTKKNSDNFLPPIMAAFWRTPDIRIQIGFFWHRSDIYVSQKSGVWDFKNRCFKNFKNFKFYFGACIIIYNRPSWGKVDISEVF